MNKAYHFYAIFALLIVTGVDSGAQPPDVWHRIYSPPGIRDAGFFYDVFRDENGEFAMAGRVHIFPANDTPRMIMWLVLADAEGKLRSQSFLPEDFLDSRYTEALSVIRTEDGGYLLGGFVEGTEFPRSFSVVKTNGAGEMLWWRTYGRGECAAVIELKSGEYLACGEGLPRIGVIVKLDDEGEVIWRREIERGGGGASMRFVKPNMVVFWQDTILGVVG